MSKVTTEQYVEIRDKMIIEFLQSAGPMQRHQFVSEWNWRFGGKDIFDWIANDSATDKATALMLYWKNTPKTSSKIYASRNEFVEKMGEMYVDEFDIIETIENLYLSGFYKEHAFAFDPTSNNGKEGIDWTSIPLYRNEVIKREIPAIMFEKLTGEEVPCSDDFSEGIPPHIWTELNSLEY